MKIKSLPKPLKYSLFLLVLGLIAGILLATVNSFTAPIIDKRKNEEAYESLKEYFKYDEFKEVTNDFDLNTSIKKVYIAKNNKETVSVIYQTSVNGYGGPVVTLIGIDITKDTFTTVKVIDASSETSNIGTKVLTHDFLLTGDDVNNYDYEIVSGATISSTAVITGVRIASENYLTNKVELGKK